MAISQTRLDAMINEQRTMFGSENLIINDYCEGVGIGETVYAHHFTPTFVPRAAVLSGQNPCVFWCENCSMAAVIHRYGRPFIDSLGRLVRRCMNDGTSRRHTNNDRERCTDKHVLLKKYQVHRGIPAHLRSQMENPDAQIERERLRQERRETTNERPSEFQDMSENAVRLRNLPDGSVERITQRPGALFATREVLDPYTERLRRETPAHTRAECGGCVGYYKPNGQLVKHRPLSMAELL
jgi:hypothetical protein